LDDLDNDLFAGLRSGGGGGLKKNNNSKIMCPFSHNKLMICVKHLKKSMKETVSINSNYLFYQILSGYTFISTLLCYLYLDLGISTIMDIPI